MSQLETAIKSVLNEASNGQVHVIQAPPGSGKSVTVRKWVTEQLRAGRFQRVLWAVHGTKKPGSLGSECREAFEQLRVRCEIVLGKDAHRERGTLPVYAPQLRWPAEPSVKIISFAHLPLLYGPEPSEQHQELKSADLLIIDEDPHASLIAQPSEAMSKPLHAEALRAAAAGSRICQVIADLLDEAPAMGESSEVICLPDLTRTTTQYSFTGEAFLREVGNDWTDSDWDAFEVALRQANVRHASLIAATFREDVNAPHLGSHRFGIEWTTGIRSDQPTFRFHVRIPLIGLPPTVVLDAYADQDLYGAVFEEYGTSVHRIGETPPLRVETCRSLHVDHLNVLTGNPEKYLQIAEEILHFTRDATRDVVLLVRKEMTDPDHRLQGYLREAARRTQQEHLLGRISFLYYHDSRGINAHAGKHVIALTEPKLPAEHHVHDLAALFPDDPEARKRVHKALEDAELLQMLNRGRQPVHQDGHELRIVSAFKPKLSPRRVEVSKYAAHCRFMPGSPNPRWRDAVVNCAHELVAALGAVPRHGLLALGLIRADKKAQLSQEDAAGYLRDALHGRPVGPILTRWLEDGSLYPYERVQAHAADHIGEALAFLEGEGFHKHQFGACKVGRTTLRHVTVYSLSRCPAGAKKALDALFPPANRTALVASRKTRSCTKLLSCAPGSQYPEAVHHTKNHPPAIGS